MISLITSISSDMTFEERERGRREGGREEGGREGGGREGGGEGGRREGGGREGGGKEGRGERGREGERVSKYMYLQAIGGRKNFFFCITVQYTYISHSANTKLQCQNK